MEENRRKGSGRKGKGNEEERREEVDINSEETDVSIQPVEYQAAIWMMLTQHNYYHGKIFSMYFNQKASYKKYKWFDTILVKMCACVYRTVMG